MNRVAETRILLCSGLLFWSVTAHADMVWPGLVLVTRLYSVIPIVLGLFIELLFLRYWFALSWKKAFIVDVVMNFVSSLAGIILIPVLGIIWELGPDLVLFKVFNIGTFNPATWVFTLLSAIFSTSIIEAIVVAFAFKIPLRRWGFWILCCANGISVTIAFVSILIHPPVM
jgi:hypothetical protein